MWKFMFGFGIKLRYTDSVKYGFPRFRQWLTERFRSSVCNRHGNDHFTRLFYKLRKNSFDYSEHRQDATITWVGWYYLVNGGWNFSRYKSTMGVEYWNTVLSISDLEIHYGTLSILFEIWPLWYWPFHAIMLIAHPCPRPTGKNIALTFGLRPLLYCNPRGGILFTVPLAGV